MSARVPYVMVDGYERPSPKEVSRHLLLEVGGYSTGYDKLVSLQVPTGDEGVVVRITVKLSDLEDATEVLRRSS